MRGVGPVCAGPLVDVRVVFPAEAKGDRLALAYVLFVGRRTDVLVNILDGLVYCAIQSMWKPGDRIFLFGFLTSASRVILKAPGLRSFSSLSLMPKRFEGGISIQYKNCIRTSRRAGGQDRSAISAKKWQTKLTVNFPK